MTTESADKKNIQKLQRAIVDGLEDVKAQDIQVFNTEHLSALFERVIVASGTSNRQTRALSASVRDAVREAGFPKPRIEGEDNGEWIIVDCGAAVVHIMQPTIRQYYHLEELWGDMPIRLKLGAAKPALPVKAAVKKVVAKEPTTLRRSSAAKSAVKAAEQAAREAKAPAKRAPARSGAARPATKAPASKAPIKTVVVKPAEKKPPAKKATAVKKAPAKKAPARKA
ncbi:MAG: ribosome silencing factor [Pseudomonadota bacterium]